MKLQPESLSQALLRHGHFRPLTAEEDGATCWWCGRALRAGEHVTDCGDGPYSTTHQPDCAQCWADNKARELLDTLPTKIRNARLAAAQYRDAVLSGYITE